MRTVPNKPPKPLKENEAAIYAVNPFYDDVLVFPTLQVPTSQDYYERIGPDKDIFRKRIKSNVTEFYALMKGLLERKRKPWWPFDEQVAVAIGVSGPKSYIELKDVDNFQKTVFDSIKGIVITDDHLIVSAEVDKYEVPFISGLIISIRKVNPHDQNIYGKDPHNWDRDRKLKMSRGGICCIDTYL